jgi:hypothetical protein
VSVLASAARSDFARFDPGDLIAAVNELYALGKDSALDAVERHLAAADRLADPQHGLFLVLRLLFEVPADPGFQPPMHIGIPSIAKPRDARALPRFPLLVVDDIPFLLVTTFVLAGSAQPVEAHLEHFRRNGTLRAEPLRPKADATPTEILSRLVAVYRDAYRAELTPAQLSMLGQQLQRLADRRS